MPELSPFENYLAEVIGPLAARDDTRPAIIAHAVQQLEAVKAHPEYDQEVFFYPLISADGHQALYGALLNGERRELQQALKATAKELAQHGTVTTRIRDAECDPKGRPVPAFLQVAIQYPPTAG